MARVKKITSITAAIVFSIMVWGCGSSGTNSSNPNTSSTPTDWHDFFQSPDYTGQLVLRFKQETDVSFNGKSLVSTKSTTDNEIETINELVEDHNGELERGLKLSEETINKALERAEREGKNLHDWNKFYRIKVENPAQAEELYRQLRNSAAIEWVEPVLKPAPGGFISTTNSSGLSYNDTTGGGSGGGLADQLYLQSDEETGGLNILAAWNHPLEIRGQGVRIGQEDFGWNYNHEALPSLTEDDILYDGEGANKINFPPPSDFIVQHGTATTSLLVAENNPANLQGLVPYSDLKLLPIEIRETTIYSAVEVIAELLRSYAENAETYSDLYIRPGDIISYEYASRSVQTPDNGLENPCAITYDEPNYCIPVEAYHVPFETIHDITEFGVVVIEGAGNGTMDLANAECNGSTGCSPFLIEDSGAIMVGASFGHNNNNKPEWSNWGERVDVYAWGTDILTAGYGDLEIPNREPPAEPSDPNTWYTNNLIGTSLSTSLITGAVSLIQSFTKEYYKEIVPHKAVYFDSRQMRDIITDPRASVEGDPEYHIGRKPDVGAAMALIEQGEYIPHVVPDAEMLMPVAHAVSGIRYDMDKDNRAELIVFDEGIVKVDLSSIEPSGGCQGYLPAGTYCESCGPETNWELPEGVCDNYGEWDLEMEITGTVNEDGVFFPVVSDYDSDGDADIGIYDSKNGYWYIKYITPEHLAKTTRFTTAWDEVIDYGSDPAWRSFGRPLVGDYNNDNWLDLVVVADGHWLIDFGGIGRLEKVGADVQYFPPFEGFEKDVKFLTDEQLAAAPGWAYLPINEANKHDIMYKTPDGITSNNINFIQSEDFLVEDDYSNSWIRNNTGIADYFNYGDNDSQFIGVTEAYDYVSIAVLALSQSANWEGFDTPTHWMYDIDVQNPSWANEGNSVCKLIAADYNGDWEDDVALLCPSGIKIAYYDYYFDAENLLAYYNILAERTVNLETGSLALPPTVYPGGMKYETIRSILERYDLTEEYRDKDPFAPHTVNCIKNWAVQPPYCLAE